MEILLNDKKVAIIKDGGLEVWYYEGSRLAFSVIYQTTDIAKAKAQEWIDKDATSN